MGVNLQGNQGSLSLDWHNWGSCFALACIFGWEPAGTIVTSGCDEWNGSYFSNDWQKVTWEDARAFSAALHRAVTAVNMRYPMTDEEAYAIKEASIKIARDLADYAGIGEFIIA